jgi:hypothetical protein
LLWCPIIYQMCIYVNFDSILIFCPNSGKATGLKLVRDERCEMKWYCRGIGEKIPASPKGSSGWRIGQVLGSGNPSRRNPYFVRLDQSNNLSENLVQLRVATSTRLEGSNHSLVI